MRVRSTINRTPLAIIGLGLAVGIPLGLWAFNSHSQKRLEESSVRQMDRLFKPMLADIIRPRPVSDYDFWMAKGAVPLWWPVNIRTDGSKTYIQFKSKEAIGFPDSGRPGDIPGIFIVKTSVGRADAWSYQIIDNVMVIDAVISKAMLIGPDSKDIIVIVRNSDKEVNPK